MGLRPATGPRPVVVDRRAAPTPAVAAITRAVDETTERARRGKLLPAFVEVMLAAGDRDAARRGVDELAEIAGIYGTHRPGGRGEPGARRGVVGRRGRSGGAGRHSVSR